ncbi:MAG: ADYC domain-containing protein [Kofleriaceae bacterium]
MNGASIIVRSDADADGNAPMVTLTIKDVAPVSAVGPDQVTRTFEGYMIVDETGASMCDIKSSNVVRARLNRGGWPERDIAGMPPAKSKNAAYAIVVPGPLYTVEGDQIDKSGGFFSLACFDDALAKRSYFGLFDPTDKDQINLTALHMLTARYCKHAYTVSGMNLTWEPSSSSPPANEILEAHWKRGQPYATCLERARLSALQVRAAPPQWPQDLPAWLLPKTCDATTWGTDWDHFASEVRTECGDKTIASSCTGDVDYDYSTSFEMAAPGSGSGSGMETMDRKNPLKLHIVKHIR